MRSCAFLCPCHTEKRLIIILDEATSSVDPENERRIAAGDCGIDARQDHYYDRPPPENSSGARIRYWYWMIPISSRAALMQADPAEGLYADFVSARQEGYWKLAQ